MRPSATPNGSEVEPGGPEDLLPGVQGAIRDFLGQPQVEADLASGRLRTGLVSFADSGRRVVGLGTNPTGVTNGLNRLRGGGFSKIDLGMRIAEQELLGSTYARPGEEDRVKLMFVYSDGQFCARDIARGGNSRDQIHIVTIGVGRDVNRQNMMQLASQREYALELRDLRELTRIFTDLLPASRGVTMDTLVVTDVLSANMMLVPNSVSPPPSSINGQMLEWTFSPAMSPFTVTYAVEPQAGGILPVSDAAAVAWTDSEGRLGSGPFPPVEIEVLLPTPTVTPTPTNTSTPTATATPEPGPKYLPFLVNRHPEVLPTATPGCVPAERTVDVVLVIDTSTSMGDQTEAGGVTKLEAAIDAGLGLVELLKFPADGSLDQAAVVSFNENAALVTPLTGDADTIRAGLNELRNRQAIGTRIDLGLEAGLAEMAGPRHRARNNRAIILVTDGRQSAPGTDSNVLAVSQSIKDQGITLWTVGLGADADIELLRQAATSADYFKHAPSAGGLRLIYEEIARVVPCP